MFHLHEAPERETSTADGQYRPLPFFLRRPMETHVLIHFEPYLILFWLIILMINNLKQGFSTFFASQTGFVWDSTLRSRPEGVIDDGGGGGE